MRRKESTWLVSPATQTTNSASPHCTARAARRRATTPLAPPNGTWSSQRGLKPKCWVSPIAVSGPTVKLDSDRPSMSALRRPARWTTSRTARPTHQWAVLVE
jgi:hypothetical protein